MARKALLLAAIAAALAFWSPRGMGLDVAIDGARGGHALLRLGIASIRIAFDSGQQCPKSDSCAGTIR